VDPSNAGQVRRDTALVQVLQAELTRAASEPNFVSLLCQVRGMERPTSLPLPSVLRPPLRDSSLLILLLQALSPLLPSDPGGKHLTEVFLEGFCRAISLGPPQATALALAIAQSDCAEARVEADRFLKGLLWKEWGEGGQGQPLPARTFSALLVHLSTSRLFAEDSQQTQEVITALRAGHAELLKGHGQLDQLSPLFTEEVALGLPLPDSLVGEANLSADMLSLADRMGATGSIAGFLMDLGPTTTSSVAILRQAVQESGLTLDEGQTAQLLGMLAGASGGVGSSGDSSDSATLTNSLLASAGGGLGHGIGDGGEGAAANRWNMHTVIQLFAEDFAGRLDWDLVARRLDFPDFYIADVAAFATLLEVYRGASRLDLPLSAMCGTWSNTRGQLSLLQAAINAPPQLFSFRGSRHRLQPLDGMDLASASPNEAWLSLDLISVLLSLSGDSNLLTQVRELLAVPVSRCPELLVLGLVSVPAGDEGYGAVRAGRRLRAEVLSRLLPPYFRTNRNPATGALIRRLFAINSALVIQACAEAFALDSSLPSLLGIARVARLVPMSKSMLLATTHEAFAIAIASVLYGLEQPGISQEERLDLESWALVRLRGPGGDAFYANLMAFVRRHMTEAVPRQSSQKALANAVEGAEVLVTCPMCLEALTAFLRALAGASSDESAPGLVQLFEQVKQVQPALLQQPSQHSEPPAVAPPGGGSAASGDRRDDVEEAANAIFARLYTSEQSVGEVLELLRRFKTSSDAREQRVFACMIHNLFDECRFFHKYPEKELRITGVLFGALIQHQLLSSTTLGIALRYVLEALRNSPGSNASGKMFRFGMFALEQFKSRLAEWPQYCSHIVQLPHLAASHPELVAEVEASMQASGGSMIDGNGLGLNQPNLPPPASPQGPAAAVVEGPRLGRAHTGPGPSLAPSPAPPPAPAPSAPDMDRIMAPMQDAEPTTQPPENVMDRIHFIINNVSQNNLSAKVGEMRTQIRGHQEYHSWIANYLVVKRISTQPNFHSLYLQFIDRLEDDAPQLMDAVLRSTFHNIGKLLRSGNIITSTRERSLLKNLGSWLGQITLARNKPILQRQLDIKELLFQGYETGRLIAVTPFGAKILEGAQNSTVFSPPNPWLTGLLSALHEMYDLADLKMNIKFEVEMLVKKLGVRLEDVPKYGRLAKRRAPNKERNPDFNVKTVAGPSAGTSPSGASPLSSQAAMASPPMPPLSMGSPAALPAIPAGGEGPTDTSAFRGGAGGVGDLAGPRAAASADERRSLEQTVIPNLAAYVTVKPNLQVFVSQPALKRVVPVAVDQAIREIIQPVVERSVTIACITTKELILKDFAMEPDEAKMRKGAHLMVTNLAGSLALVTCKEPLRVSISQHLRQLLNTHAPALDAAALEQVVSVCAMDNLELGCMLIEKAATEKATRDIDDALPPAMALRRKEVGGYYGNEMSMFSGAGGGARYPAALPEPLRPNPGGLQPPQLMVYEAFQRLPRQPAVTPRDSPSLGASSPGLGAQGAAAAGEVSVDVALAAWQSAMGRLDAALQLLLTQAASAGRSGELSLSMVGLDTDLSSALHEVMAVAQKVAAPMREEALLKFSQTVFRKLFKAAEVESAAEVPLLRVEVYVAVLELCLRDLKNIAKEDVVTRWYTSRPPVPMVGEGERKLQKAALTMFIRAKMIKIPELDIYIARNISNPPSTPSVSPERASVAWAEFGMSLVRQCVFDHNTQVAAGPDAKSVIKKLAHVLEALSRASQVYPGSVKRQFDKLMTDLRVVASASRQGDHGVVGETAESGSADASPAAPARDRVGAREQVANLLEYWLRLCMERPGDAKSYAPYLALLQQQGVLASDEATEWFLRVATELVVESCLKSARPVTAVEAKEGESFGPQVGTTAVSYNVVDVYGKLLVLLIKSVGTADPREGTTARIAMLTKVLSSVARVLLMDFETKKASNSFDQRPHFRLFLCLLQDLNAPDRVLDMAHLQVLSAFASTFHAVQPTVVPAFAFAWLELVSHRSFMPTLLLAKMHKGWALMHQLLVDMFAFVDPLLRKPKLNDSVRLLYKGMLRVLLVLLHDFPEFLCEYHLSFCDAIPPCCIQLRNLMLSAFPRSMRLPDPFTPNLKVDLLPEISQPPRILSNYAAALNYGGLRVALDKYLITRTPSQFLSELPSKLRMEGSLDYNVPVINSLVVYVGSQAIVQLQNKSTNITQSAPMDVFQRLVDALDPQGRYHFLNAIANQLRYPNNHTHYFSCVLLYLFEEAGTEAVQEQITRILLERLIVHRPHPW
jgi:CCR4-NOT transcription complex subunit 1